MQTQQALLDRLEIEVRDMTDQVRAQFMPMDLNKLQTKVSPEKWSILDCMAHLNAYSEHYIPKFEHAIHKAKARQWGPVEEMNSTWLGRRCVRSVDPAFMEKSRMKAPKKFNPTYIGAKPDAVKAFLAYQEMWLRLIRHAREVDLNRAKVSISQLPFLKLRLGDFFEFVCAHERRHVLQAMHVKQQLGAF